MSMPRPGALIRRAWQPFQAFFQNEVAGGILLLIAAAVALLWANISPDSYTGLWETPVTIGAPHFNLTLSLQHWINDGLMAIFFFLVGLEIKREILVGELASVRRATLPIAAAIGGMAVPAIIYAIFNHGTPASNGWGIPMATDIAFALGILALLGSRIPPGLRVFLAALAIVDDLGAVIVIALFYTTHISWVALGVGIGTFVLLLFLNRLGMRATAGYASIGLVLWGAFLLSGVHATIAGVLLAMAVPARTRIDAESFIHRARTDLDDFAIAGRVGKQVLVNEEQQAALQNLETATEDVQSPLQRLEHALSGIVAFGIVPIFALANAGVILVGGIGAPYTWRAFLGTSLGLLVGKPIGVMVASWLAISGGALRPNGVAWRHLFGASLLAGIGFTMAIFIANLAFSLPTLLPAAKIGILAASPLAAIAGLLVLGTMSSTSIERGATLATPPEE